MPKYDCTGIIPAVSSCLFVWKECQVSQTSNVLSKILLKLAEVMRQMSKLDWHDYNSQMLTWANKPGSLSLGQNSCSLKYCWMMSGVHAKTYSREKEVDRRYGANIPPLCICQVHWGRMLTVLESQQHVQDLMLEERRKWTLSKDSQGPEGCCFSPKSPAGLTD